LRFITNVTTKPRSGHAAKDTGGTREWTQWHNSDFDPDVPGYVFWLVMLMLITFHQLVLHVR
jgi:hypothetical protein